MWGGVAVWGCAVCGLPGVGGVCCVWTAWCQRCVLCVKCQVSEVCAVCCAAEGRESGAQSSRYPVRSHRPPQGHRARPPLRPQSQQPHRLHLQEVSATPTAPPSFNLSLSTSPPPPFRPPNPGLPVPLPQSL